MIHMTQVVMRYAPIGVFALMAVVVSQHGLAVFAPVGQIDSGILHRYGFVGYLDLHPDRGVHHPYSGR